MLTQHWNQSAVASPSNQSAVASRGVSHQWPVLESVSRISRSRSRSRQLQSQPHAGSTVPVREWRAPTRLQLAPRLRLATDSSTATADWFLDWPLATDSWTGHWRL